MSGVTAGPLLRDSLLADCVSDMAADAETLDCLNALASGEFREAVRYAYKVLESRRAWAVSLLARCLIRAGDDLAAALRYGDLAVGQGFLENDVVNFVIFEHMRVGDFLRASRLALAIYGPRQAFIASASASLAPWKGEQLRGKRVVVGIGQWSRQRNGGMGFGDEICWARFAPELSKLGAKVYLRCQPPLERLFASIPNVTTLTGRRTIEADYSADALLIPARLGMTRETIPGTSFLSVERAMELPASRAFKVGISWGCGDGGPQYRYCALSELAEISGIEGTQLYSLDKTRHAAQLYPPPQGMNVIDLATKCQDFADTAAAINAMDVVVSTDNVIANLAGALGKCVLLLHVHGRPEMRWGEGDRTPWYRSARVFRQPKPGHWRGAVARVADEIRRLMLKRKLAA